MSAVPVCGPRDLLDVLSAVGPTVAAFIAVGVAIWQVWLSRSALTRERQRTAPLIRIQKTVGTPAPDVYQLLVAISNVGETRALVESFALVVDGNTRSFDPAQTPPPQFWAGVLDTLGVVGYQVREGNMPVPPFSLAAAETRTLLVAVVHGPNPNLPTQFNERLKCRGTYVSIWGERKPFPAAKPSKARPAQESFEGFP
jgi:hypothetical protein